MFARTFTILATLVPATAALAQSKQEIIVQRASSQAPSIGPAQTFTTADSPI
jgi:hypothetical protein